MIKSVQPYRKVADPEQHPLWKLHVLNVGDKHRRPHLVGAVLQGTKVDVLEYEDVDIELFLSSFRFWIGPFKNGATVQTATLKATGENPMVNFEAGHSFGVAFGVNGGARAAPVVATLT